MSLNGDIRSKPIMELFNWLDVGQKTGTLILKRNSDEKCFCFHQGKIIFVSSKKEGERLGEYLATNVQVDENKIKESLLNSRNDEVPFMQYLIDHKIVPKEFLVVAIEELAETLLVDVLRWDDGTYEFIEGLPDLVDKEFISISTNYLVFKALQQSDEKMRPEEE